MLYNSRHIVDKIMIEFRMARELPLNTKYKKITKQFLFKIPFIALILYSSFSTSAVVFDHGPALTIGTSYESNIQYLPSNFEESVVLYRASPEYRLSAQDGNNDWYARIGLNVQRSSNETISRDRDDPFGTIGWKRLLQDGSFFVQGEFVQESTRQTQFGQTNALLQDATSKTKTLTTGWEKRLSEKFNLMLGAGYEEVSFSDDTAIVVPGFATDFSDFNSTILSSQLNYLYTEKIQPYALIEINRFKSESDGLAQPSIKVEYQNYYAGAQFNLSPNLIIDVKTGISRIDSDTDESEWVGAFVTNYKTARQTFLVDLSRQVFDTGLGRIERGDQLDLGYTFAISEKSRLGSNLNLSQNASGIDTQEVTANYQRDLSLKWTMEGLIGYGNIKNEGFNSTDNRYIGINLIYNPLPI